MKTSSRFYNYMSVMLPSDGKPISGKTSHVIMMEAVEVYKCSLLGGASYAVNNDKGAMISLLAFKDHSLIMMYMKGMDNPPAIVTSAPLDSLDDFDWWLSTIGVKKEDIRELERGESIEGVETTTLYEEKET